MCSNWFVNGIYFNNIGQFRVFSAAAKPSPITETNCQAALHVYMLYCVPYSNINIITDRRSNEHPNPRLKMVHVLQNILLNYSENETSNGFINNKDYHN